MTKAIIQKIERGDSGMNELIKVKYDNDNPTVSGRELHEFLAVKSKYADWFKNMCAYGFTANTDFSAFSKNLENGGRTIDHQITIEMAKEICMLQRNEKGKQARQYFINLEKAWNTPEVVMSRALKMAANKINALSLANSELQAERERNKPLVLFAEAVSVSNSAILVGELAKILKGNGVEIGQNRLFEELRQMGYLIKRKGTDYNMPTQRSMELELFKIKETAITHADGHVTTSKTAKVTGKGQQYFVNLFLKKQSA